VKQHTEAFGKQKIHTPACKLLQNCYFSIDRHECFDKLGL